MAGHHIGFCNVGHQTDPAEDSDKDIDGPLDPVEVLQSDEAVIRIEHSHTPYHFHTKPVIIGGFPSTLREIHCQTTLSTATLKSVG